MSSINGFGTLYYGWRHGSDGTATATKWFVISWLPIVPLERQRLRVLTDFSHLSQPIESRLGGFVISQTDSYRIIEKTGLSAKEIGMTLAKAYLGLPALLVLPLLALTPFMLVLLLLGIRPDNSPIFAASLSGVGFLIFGNFLYQIIRAIRRARGWQPRIQ